MATKNKQGYNKFKRAFRDGKKDNFIDAKNPTGLNVGNLPQPITFTTDNRGRNYIQILPTRRNFDSNRYYLKKFPGYRILECYNSDDEYD